MKHTLLLSFLLIGLAGFSQKVKVKIKDNIATINGEPFLKIESQEMNTMSSIYLLDSDEEIIFISRGEYYDRAEITESNPKGRVSWAEINFLGLKVKCEIGGKTRKGLIKLFYQNKIFVDGKLNEENAQRFCEKYGMKFSENRPGGNVNIIINN